MNRVDDPHRGNTCKRTRTNKLFRETCYGDPARPLPVCAMSPFVYQDLHSKNQETPAAKSVLEYLLVPQQRLYLQLGSPACSASGQTVTVVVQESWSDKPLRLSAPNKKSIQTHTDRLRPSLKVYLPASTSRMHLRNVEKQQGDVRLRVIASP